MAFSPQMAERRFGYGLSPVVQPPQSVAQMISRLSGPDVMRAQFPAGDFHFMQTRHAEFTRFRKHAKANQGTEKGEASRAKQNALRVEVRSEYFRRFVQLQLRRVFTPDALRERLVSFWGDHFTAMGKYGLMRWGTSLYVEEAVRPHVNGRFVDMLKSAVKHPLMLHYLDQDFSAGPNSRYAKRRGGGRGLNENLAREVMELHTLGVGAAYSQDDVRALASLFTGLGRGSGFGIVFRPARAEPGPQTLLGRTYSRTIGMERIDAVLQDLAAHPATAAHVARKLAVHFVADVPPPDLVAALTQTYLDSDGDLLAVTAAMLEHPQAWEGPATNVRPPDEFVSASLRAMAVGPDDLGRLDEKDITSIFTIPLRRMGQDWQKAPGPDGWAEEDAAWITPQGLAGRMEWAMRAPTRMLRQLPDPRRVVQDALGDDPPPNVVFAAAAAERKAEAIGLILISPAFQRR